MRQVSIYGKRFQVEEEPSDFWGWVGDGRYNSEWAILDKFVRPEHTFIDLGAWVGSHSLYASTISKWVISVEPDPIAFDILKGNIVANGYTGTPVRVAITGHQGKITLGSGLLGASTTRANSHEGAGIGPWVEGQTFEVPCTTLRDFVQAISDPMFIKMDVEGSEEQILQDTEFFAEHKPTMYLELHPFWWKNEQAGWDSVRRVAGLYKNVLDIHMRGVDLNAVQPRALILTNEA